MVQYICEVYMEQSYEYRKILRYKESSRFAGTTLVFRNDNCQFVYYCKISCHSGTISQPPIITIVIFFTISKTLGLVHVHMLHFNQIVFYWDWTYFLLIYMYNNWARERQNQQTDMCAQRRIRSAWASAHSDQSLCYKGQNHSKDSDQTEGISKLI